MFGRFLFVAILFLFPFGIFSGDITFSDFYHFSSRSWNAVSGLPHNNVSSFYRDEKGLLWVGTVEGLVRIDSKSSKIFNTSTTRAILSNKINDLSGCYGKIFVATPMGVSEISDSGLKISKLAETHAIFDIETLTDCTLFATNGKEIMMIKSNKISKLSEITAFPESPVSVLFSDGFALYAGFENGEIRIFGEDGFSGNLCGANSSPVTAGRAKDGRIFAGNADGTVFELKNGKCLKIARTESHKAVTSLDFQEKTVAFVSDGALFFAEGGALKPCGSFCADNGSISKVMLDDDFLWLSGSRGVTLFYPGKFITLGRESGLFSEKVYAVLEDDSGRIWAGTRGGGLFVYENGKFRYLKDRKGDIGRLVGGLFQNDDGSILVGTTSGVISFLPEKPSVFKKMKVSRNGSMNAVSVIFRDRKSRLWAGGSGGAIYLDTKDGWHLLRKFGDESDLVSAIAQDSRGNLWFAASKGLWQLDRNDEFHEINQGVDGNMPVSLFVDENDVVFVGSMHRGLTLIFPDLKSAQLDSRKGLCSDTILGMTADESGNLWFSSTNGIFSLSKQEVVEAAKSENGSLSCTPFDSTDGIRRPESTGGVQPSVLKRRNGDLWFPTLEGIAVLRQNGRKPVKFDSLVPEENPTIIVKSEEKSNFSGIFVILAVFASVILVFAVKKAFRPRLRTLSSVGDLTPEPLSGVARGEDLTPESISEAVRGEKNEVAEPVEQSQDNSENIEPETEFLEIIEEIDDEPHPRPLSSVARGDELVSEPVSEAAKDEDLISEPVSETARGDDEELFDPAADEVEEKRKYEGYQLDEEIAAAYAAEARELMEKEKLYRNPYLTMPEVAKKLKLSTNTLSQVLNGYCGQTFYNFINTYRLEEVIAMMHDPKCDGKSILKLSIEAGFNTKSTFNNIFKKRTGLTPAEFRRNIGNQEKKQ